MNCRKIAAGAAVTFALASAPASAEITLTYASWIPLSHPVNTEIYLPWAKAIEKDSMGEIKFRILPKGIGHPRAYLDAVRTNQIDAGFSTFNYSAKRFSVYLLVSMPFMGERAKASSVAFHRTHEKFFAGKDFFAGAHLIGVNTHGPGLIFTRDRFVKKPSDMKGLKMRNGGPIPRKITETWGGVSIRTPASKSYEILSTGIADGITFPWESVNSFKIVKLVPYATNIPGGMFGAGFFLVMNKKKYDAMSQAAKKAVDKNSAEAFARMAGSAWDRMNDAGEEDAKKAGTKVLTAPKPVVDSVKEINKEFIANYIADAKKRGIDGEAVLKFYHSELAKLQGK